MEQRVAARCFCLLTWTAHVLAIGQCVDTRLQLDANQKKMIILHMGTEEHRDPGTSAPQGEPWTPPSVLTPQSPCTATRAVGVGTLYRDTIYAATAMDKCNHALLHVAGWGVITPVELEARPGSGALLLSIEPMLERQSACKRQIKGNH